jgi:hypothetical protein
VPERKDPSAAGLVKAWWVLPNTGYAHFIFKGSKVVGRRERIVRAGQDKHTSRDLTG